MWILAARFLLHVPHAASLKEKRRAVRPVVDGIKARFNCAVAEVDGMATWQRADIGVALVGADAGVLRQALQKVERFVASHPEFEVLDIAESIYQTDDD